MKNNTTILCPVRLDSGFKAISAEPLQICGHTFALHKSTRSPAAWAVTDIRSGFVLVAKQGTRELALTEAKLRLNSYGVERALELIARHPEAPATETLERFEHAAKADKADIDRIVDLIAETCGGLDGRGRKAVLRALNSRTGQLKAKAPSAFGDADERLAAAAWQGLQPNGYKVGPVSVFAIGHHEDSKALWSKLTKHRWPAAFDKDKAAPVAAGVW